MRVPALCSTRCLQHSPAQLTPGVMVWAQVGCTQAALPEHPLPARSLPPAWALCLAGTDGTRQRVLDIGQFSPVYADHEFLGHIQEALSAQPLAARPAQGGACARSRDTVHPPAPCQPKAQNLPNHTPKSPPFTRLEALPGLSGLSAEELRIKLPETLEAISPPATAPTQKQSLSLQLLRALTSKLNSCFGKPQTP